jgi:broad specificity phosphatase PhoE
VRCDPKIEVTDRVQEWNYGDYEGITSKEIKQKRTEQGLGSWDIWSDGCPGGEYDFYLHSLVIVLILQTDLHNKSPNV